jgi:hypothetical protein
MVKDLRAGVIIVSADASMRYTIHCFFSINSQAQLARQLRD